MITQLEKYGPINSIVLSRAGGSDNIYLRDEKSVQQNGLCELKISDNQIMNFNNRDEFLPEILNKLNGTEYYLNDFTSTGIMYYDLCDRYNVQIGNNTYSCVMFNDDCNITQGLEEIIYTDEPETSETDYTKADKTDRKINQTYLIVDKQNQQIEAVISQTTQQNEKINRVTQTVDELNSKISDIADITISKESNEGFVEFEKVNQSEPIRLVIRPIVENISYLYPSDNLFPSDTLFPKSRTIRFENITNGTHVDYELPTDLLYYDNQNYDEFILDYDAQTCLVNKKVGYNADGTTYVLETPLTLEYNYQQILLEDGDYKISVLGYSPAYIFARVMAQNIYTTQFATKAEVSSSINQTAQNINLSVDKKLTNYSTTTQMNSAINIKANEITSNVSKTYATKGELNTAKSEIKQTTDIISSTVSKKVGNDEIISKINQSAETVGIDANKIELSANDVLNLLAGKTINLSSKNIQISSKHLNIGKDGKLKVIGVTSSSDIFRVETSSGSDFTYLQPGGAGFVGSSGRIDIQAQRDNSALSAIYLEGIGGNTTITNNYIKTPTLTQTSKEDLKKNFEKLKNALDIVKQTDIYKYNLKSEEDGTKKHIGFVIGDKYNYAEELTSINNDGADIYSLASVCLQAIKEQQEEIELLKQEIIKLKGEQ